MELRQRRRRCLLRIQLQKQWLLAKLLGTPRVPLGQPARQAQHMTATSSRRQWRPQLPRHQLMKRQQQ